MSFTPHPRHLLIAANEHDLKDFLPTESEDTYFFVSSAAEARDAWENKGASEWDAVVSSLEPGGSYREAGDTAWSSDPGSSFLSGIALFNHIRANGGDNTPLICQVNGAHTWGGDALFAMATAQWFHGQVMDTADPAVPRGGDLTQWLCQGQRAATDTLDRVTSQASVTFEEFLLIENESGRRGPHSTIDNAVHWLRTICGDNYMPQTITRHLKDGEEKSGTPAPSAPTVKHRLAFTFNAMRPIAVLFDEKQWTELDVAHAPSHFWDDSATLPARIFLSHGYEFFAFDDIDAAWAAQAKRLARERRVR